MRVSCGIILSVLLSPAVVQAQPSGLFSATSRATLAQADSNDTRVIRRRVVDIDFDQLPGRGARPAAGDRGTTLSLNLFADAVYTAVLDRLDAPANGSVWVGHVPDKPLSTVTLATVNGVMAGSVVMPGETYSIRSTADGSHVIEQVDQSAYPPEAEPRVPDMAAPVPRPGLASATPVTGDMQPDSGGTIDVMVLYTPATVTARGEAGAQALVNLGISETNTAYANSGVTQRLNLVFTGLVNYTEGATIFDDLDALTASSSVAAARSTYRADLVTLLTNKHSTSACGVAWLMTNVSAGFASSGFNVVEQICVSPNYSFEHELGHNMGLRHDWYVDSEVTPYSWAHGHINVTGRWRTIMSYNNLCPAVLGGNNNCTRLLRFSNPAQSYGGAPLGIAGGTNTSCVAGNTSAQNCDADERRVLNDTAYTVANFMSGAPTGTAPSVTSNPSNVETWANWRVAFSAAASGSPTPTVQWQYSANGGATWNNLSVGTYASATWSSVAAIGYNGYRIRAVFTNAYGSAATAAAVLTVHAPSDFNGDGWPDLVWRNTTSGQVSLWLMSGASYSGYVPVGSLPDQAWQVVATADLNGDFMPDLVWRNRNTGENSVWYMNGTTYWSSATLPLADTNWRLAGSADFNLDGRGDLVWRNYATGQNLIWYMNGSVVSSTAAIDENVADPAWKLVATADFDFNAKPDLLWRNTTTGQNVIWFQDNTGFMGSATLPPIADANWSVAMVADFNRDNYPDIVWRNYSSGQDAIWYLGAAGTYSSYEPMLTVDTPWHLLQGPNIPTTTARTPSDFNQDGYPDILWRNGSTGENIIWLMNGGTYGSYRRLETVSDLWWKSVATGDFNQDGHQDILWRNNSTGQNIVWFMNGTNYVGYTYLDSVPISWKLGAVADFNSDGKVDLLWRNGATGENIVWYMNGTAYSSYERLVTANGVSWRIVAAADFNSDGKADLLWHNTATGENILWYMNGASYVGYARLDTVSETTWFPVMAADFNADGKPDIFWRNTFTGENIIWYMNGAAYGSYTWVLSVNGSDWRIGPQQQ